MTNAGTHSHARPVRAKRVDQSANLIQLAVGINQNIHPKHKLLA